MTDKLYADSATEWTRRVDVAVQKAAEALADDCVKLLDIEVEAGKRDQLTRLLFEALREQRD